jgi:hypothetical protein
MEVHQFGADVPEEDDLLLQHSMLYPHVDTYELESELVLDEWHRLRCDDASMRAAYRDHRLLLQAIMSTRALDAASVCMLKSTVHGAFLDHLTGEHPQAVFVQTHRNAFDSVASMAYLRLCLNDTLMKSCDAPALAERILQFEAWHMQRLLAYRRSLPAADEARRFVDVHFDDIGADPIGVVEQIYAHFGFVVCDEHRQAMQSYIATHRSSSSTGRFDASQLFKLERSRVDAIFADYERFRASSIVKRKSGERRA